MKYVCRCLVTPTPGISPDDQPSELSMICTVYDVICAGILRCALQSGPSVHRVRGNLNLSWTDLCWLKCLIF
jgi:hypothetical protein